MWSIDIQRCKQVGGPNARRVRLAHGQQYVEIDQPSKESQKHRMQIGVPLQEGCTGLNCKV